MCLSLENYFGKTHKRFVPRVVLINTFVCICVFLLMIFELSHINKQILIHLFMNELKLYHCII